MLTFYFYLNFVYTLSYVTSELINVHSIKRLLTYLLYLVRKSKIWRIVKLLQTSSVSLLTYGVMNSVFVNSLCCSANRKSVGIVFWVKAAKFLQPGVLPIKINERIGWKMNQ